MSKISRILQSKRYRVAWILYGILYPLLGIPAILYVAFNSTMMQGQGKCLYLFLVVALFGVPVVIQNYAKGKFHLKDWEERGLNWSYRITVFFTVFSSLLWFSNPEKLYLEPITNILTLVSAWIIYHRNLKPEQKTPSEQNIAAKL